MIDFQRNTLFHIVHSVFSGQNSYFYNVQCKFPFEYIEKGKVNRSRAQKLCNGEHHATVDIDKALDSTDILE